MNSEPDLLPQTLRALVGVEHDLDLVAWLLKRYADAVRAPVVGAFQITCSDESERECVDSFDHIFARDLLPELKYSSHSSFRAANLGGRYERGAIIIAEDHFATPASMEGFKLLVVKLNSHVSVVDTEDGPRYGRMQRYDRDSVYCGALHATLDGATLPVVAELTELFGSGGRDRLAALRAMDSDRRGLLAAIAAAHLQAERILADIEAFEQRSPTLYLVVAGVTLNRLRDDSELVCSLTAVDRRGAVPLVEHIGLGDDPTRYRIHYEAGKLTVGNH